MFSNQFIASAIPGSEKIPSAPRDLHPLTEVSYIANLLPQRYISVASAHVSTIPESFSAASYKQDPDPVAYLNLRLLVPFRLRDFPAPSHRLTL